MDASRKGQSLRVEMMLWNSKRSRLPFSPTLYNTIILRQYDLALYQSKQASDGPRGSRADSSLSSFLGMRRFCQRSRSSDAAMLTRIRELERNGESFGRRRKGQMEISKSSGIL